MQQRQLRLGDILDDYCPRERRLTNHAVVAMVGDTVKQTRCTTCDTEHEYKHAKVPRQRRKNDAPAALYAQVAAGAPKRIAHDHPLPDDPDDPGDPGDPGENDDPGDTGDAGESDAVEAMSESASNNGSATNDPQLVAATSDAEDVAETVEPADENESLTEGDSARDAEGEGPIHRRLIRASLPRPEGQQPPARPIPEFTIRQPGGRQNRFRPRHGRGGSGGQGQPGHQFGGNRSNGNMGGMRGGRPGGGGGGGMTNRRGQGGGRKRSK
jgi:hypothetical protein